MHRHALAEPAAAECEDPLDQCLGAASRMNHLIEVTPRHAPLYQVFLRELAVAEDRAQDVVEVVRDAACERAHCFHLLRLTELSLEALLRVFGLLALNGDARKMGDLL